MAHIRVILGCWGLYLDYMSGLYRGYIGVYIWVI